MKKLLFVEWKRPLIKFDLQLLDGDGGGEGGDGGNGSGGDNGAGGAGGAAKTFSQEDVNNIVAKESKSAIEKILKDLGVENVESAKEGLAAFKKIQDENLSDLEKLQGKVGGYETSLAEKDAIIKGYENKEIVMSLGVPVANAAKVLKLAELEDGDDLKANVEKVLQEFPMFKDSSLGGDDGGNGGQDQKPGRFGAGSKGGGGGHKAGSPDKDAIMKAMGLGRNVKK